MSSVPFFSLVGNARTVGTITADLQHHQVRTEEKPSSCARCPQVLQLHRKHRQAEVPQLLFRWDLHLYVDYELYHTTVCEICPFLIWMCTVLFWCNQDLTLRGVTLNHETPKVHNGRIRVNGTLLSERKDMKTTYKSFPVSLFWKHVLFCVFSLRIVCLFRKGWISFCWTFGKFWNVDSRTSNIVLRSEGYVLIPHFVFKHAAC